MGDRARAELVGSSAVEVIAVKEKPLGPPAFFKYLRADTRLGVGQTAETGLEVDGPSGTGPTTCPWPKTESLSTC